MSPVMIHVELIDHEQTGLLVRRKRKEVGLTLMEVSIRSELSVSYLSELERGDRAWTNELFQRVWSTLR